MMTPASPCNEGRAQWRAFRWLTVLIILLGIGCIVLGTAATISSLYACKGSMDNRFEDERSRRPVAMQREELGDCMLISSHIPGIVGGILFIVAGSIGVGASRSMVTHRRSGLKTGFMVICIINAMIIGPGCVAGPIPHILLLGVKGRGALALLECLAGLVGIILSIVGASFACCCTPAEQEKVVLLNVPITPTSLNMPPDPMVSTLSLPRGDTVGLLLNEEKPRI